MKQYCVYLLLFLIAVSNATDKKAKHQGTATVGSHAHQKPGKADKKAVKPKAIKPSTKESTVKKVKNPSENLEPVLSDWLQIASSQFKNKKKFPVLFTPDGKELKIKLDGQFRINDAYKKDDPNSPPSDHDFWFRLSGKSIYYSINKNDMNVLGALHLKSIKDVVQKQGSDEDATCFQLIDTKESNWKLCGADQHVKNKWVCGIKKALKILDPSCGSPELADPEITVLTKKVTQPIILIPLPQRMCNENFKYQQHGDDWECDCKEGKEQSPVDLPARDSAKISPVKPVFQYEEIKAKDTRPNEAGEMKSDQFLKIVLENNVIKIKNKSFGKIVTLDGSVYVAEEIVFHSPAEHKINGKQYDLEMQIIHKGQTKGDIAKHAILSFVFEKKAGVYNQFLDDVDFFNLPNQMNKERDIINNLSIPKVFYSSESEDLPIMKPFAFYTYQGSLTAPPCTERTIHYVAAKPIPIGNIVVQLFQEAVRVPDMMDNKGNVIVNTAIPDNNRKVQPLNGRTVYYYNYVEEPSPDAPRPKPKQTGHYEKVNKKMVEYFYVGGNRPSGLPGAFVVSENEAKGKQ